MFNYYGKYDSNYFYGFIDAKRLVQEALFFKNKIKSNKDTRLALCLHKQSKKFWHNPTAPPIYSIACRCRERFLFLFVFWK